MSTASEWGPQNSEDSLVVMSIYYCINGCTIDGLTLVRTLVLHVFTQLVPCIQCGRGGRGVAMVWPWCDEKRGRGKGSQFGGGLAVGR